MPHIPVAVWLIFGCAAQAAAKRFKVTGSGKVIIRHSGKQHINEKKPAKRLSQLGKPNLVSCHVDAQ